MRKNCFVESTILYPKTVKFENLKKIAKAQFSLALPHIQHPNKIDINVTKSIVLGGMYVHQGGQKTNCLAITLVRFLNVLPHCSSPYTFRLKL